MRRIGQNLRDSLRILFLDVDYKGFEVFNGIVIFVLGCAFIFLNSSRVILTSSLSYFPYSEVIYSISSIMIIFGVLKIIAIIRNDVFLRKWLAFVSSFLWAFLFVIFSNRDIKPTSIVFMIVIILFSMWAYIRLVVIHRGQRLIDPRDPFENN